MAREISYNNFEISLVVFLPNITTNHAITYTNKVVLINNIYGCQSRMGIYNISNVSQEGGQCHRRSQYEANRGTRLGKILPNTVDFYFFIRLIILEDFIRLISYNGPCVRLGCSFFLATALPLGKNSEKQHGRKTVT